MNYNIARVLVFLLTFLAYAGLHALREGWSYSKSQLRREMDVAKTDLGLIDTLYLVSYSVGMAILGSLMNRVSLKLYIVGGLVASILFYVSFALLYAWFDVFFVPLMGVMMCLNGFFQATGWPGLMGVVGNWFEKDKKGLLMAVWAMNANAGNIIASALCNLLSENGASWTANFIVTGAFAGVVAILILIFLREKPDKQPTESKSLPDPSKESEDKLLTQSVLTTQDVPAQKLNVFKALLLPRVPFYVVGYSCLKGCIYGLLFWLPTYLSEKSLDSQMGYIASMIDIGALVGGMSVGFLTDRFDRRAIFLAPLLIVCSVVMFIVSYADLTDAWQYYLAMFLIGTFIGGPYNIIGTVIAIDLGQQSGMTGNIVAVSSLIEGSAALFAAISQLVISYISFDVIFYLFAGECIVAALVLTPLLINEVKAIRLKRNTQ